MISVKMHAEGSILQNDLPIEAISDILAADKHLLWVDAVRPTPDDLRVLQEEFNFHPLAFEDLTKRQQRPKLDRYPGLLFIVFYGFVLRGERPESVGVYLCVGANYLVTVHDGEIPELAHTAERWCAGIDALGKSGISLLLHSLLDAIVDGYFPIVDALADRIEEIEVAVFERRDPAAQQRIFALRKDLLAVRRVLGPERDVMNELVRRDTPMLDEATVVYFQDVYDHILRVTDVVDTYRDLLSSVLDAHLSVTSNNLNNVMRTLTASSIILMSMTLVAGIYGMNFVHMPELDWRFGYPAALVAMAAIGSIIYAIFRRVRWL